MSEGKNSPKIPTLRQNSAVNQIPSAEEVVPHLVDVAPRVELIVRLYIGINDPPMDEKRLKDGLKLTADDDRLHDKIDFSSVRSIVETKREKRTSKKGSRSDREQGTKGLTFGEIADIMGELEASMPQKVFRRFREGLQEKTSSSSAS